MNYSVITLQRANSHCHDRPPGAPPTEQSCPTMVPPPSPSRGHLTCIKDSGMNE
jgi:hypothetical protein